MVDNDGPEGKSISLFESGAMLIYLADKVGKFLSSEVEARYTTFQWLMWQMGGVGPMFGQSNHFSHYAPEKIDYAIDRYNNELVEIHRISQEEMEAHRHHLRTVIEAFTSETGSEWGRELLEEFGDYVGKFWLVKPKASSLESLLDNTTSRTE